MQQGWDHSACKSCCGAWSCLPGGSCLAEQDVNLVPCAEGEDRWSRASGGRGLLPHLATHTPGELKVLISTPIPSWPGGSCQMCLFPQMKISFNDKSLQTTFEYPSESSLVQEEEADAEEEEEGEEGEEEEEEEGPGSEKPFALFLPRATFVSSVGPENPQLLDGSSGECPPVGTGRLGGVQLGHSSICPCMCSLAHRPVQLHSQALLGLQQVAGTNTGAGPERGGAPHKGGHGEPGRVGLDAHSPRAIWWGWGVVMPRQDSVAAFCLFSAHTCQSE